MHLILASTSPRRIALLKLSPYDFEVGMVSIDECRWANEQPIDYIKRMTQDKMTAAIKNLSINQPTLILTADTIGVMATGEILTKPNDQKDAFRMWSLMGGTSHEVWTAVRGLLLVDGQPIFEQDILERTEVCFKTLSQSEMARYWATGEPLDKAGAYAIQGYGAAWVDKIYGSYSNVVGLPLVQVIEMIEAAQRFLEDRLRP